MSVLDKPATRFDAPPAVTAPRPVKPASTTRRLGDFQCLVVSLKANRGRMLEQAAGSGGWDTVACSDLSNAWTAVKRQKFGLAVVDLDGIEDVEDLRGLCEEVAKMKDTLLVVCGNEGEALEEIWARQLGAWLYLPGVATGDALVSLCEQARPVVEKLTGNFGCRR